MIGIKFRVWDKIQNKMNMNCSLYNLWIYRENVGLNNIFYYDDVIFMRYTWLKDKEWKEIYKWDLIESQLVWDINKIKQVEYINEVWAYMIWWELLSRHLYDKQYWDLYYIKSPVIIGNIYENSNLLTK